MKRVFLILLLGSMSLFATAQRTESPFQFQLNMQGAFMKTFGQALSNQEIESFEVENWAFPGIMAGYHLNHRWYIGYNYQPSRDQSIVEPWGLSEQRQDAHIMVNYETGHVHSLDLRFSPFKNGFYLQSSFMHISEAQYHMDASRLSDELQIGNNLYATDMEATWHFKQVNTLALGLGYNHVTRSGWSFGASIIIPIISDPYQDIIFMPSDESVDIDPVDLEMAGRRLAQETFYYPVQINLLVGFNFNWKK